MGTEYDGAADAPGETPIQGLENYTRDELKSIVREYVSSILSENGIESELVDVELHGSRGRGTARKDSDLDAVVEYRGDIREDSMFNMLNDEDSRLVIDGISVDVNPIRAEETGTMQSYMTRSREYDSQVLEQQQADESDALFRVTLQQAHDSAATSINGNKLPAAFNKIEWKEGSINLDLGGGKFDNATEFLKDKGVENLIFDPFNRDTEWNRMIAEQVQAGCVDSVTCNNVLNVIDNEASMENVILQASKALKPDGVAYFYIYEGDKSGVGKDKGQGRWQNNLTTQQYIPAVSKYFGDVKRRGQLIEARNPIPTDEQSVWSFDGAYDGNNEVRFSTVAITPEVRQEMDEIIAKAKEEGTYLKAPNGNDTILTPEQWAMVRTKMFKEWFGDWELAARIINIVAADQNHGFKNFGEAKEWAKANIVRTLSNEETGGKGEIRISNNAISKFLSESAISKSESKDIHLSVLKVLPDVIKESLDAEQHPDYKKGEDGVRSVKNGVNEGVTIHRLYGAVSIDGQVYRTKVAIKEYADKNRPQKAYSYEATKIELFAETLVGADSSNPNTNNSISAANLLNGVEKSYSPGEKLIDSSKIVDENGEPKVVYHGFMGNDFNVFDKDIAAENSISSQPVYGAFFFSDNKDNASSYGTKSDNGVRSFNGLKEVFLKADNPFVVDANGEQYHSVKAYFKERDTGEINWERGGIVMDGNEVGVQDITIAARDLGYDSVIFKNIDDPGSEDFVGKPQTTIAVFSPTQIKSATDNTGAYSNNNPDVRFRAVPVEGNKNLVAIHNLKEQDLRNAFELGGFPMPSIAITKAEVGHTDFGDISLIFDKNSIDPRNRKNKVYGGDAWTPMFPKIAYKLNYDKTRDIYRRAVNVGELPMFNSSNFNNVNYEDSIDDTGESGLINSFKDDYGAKQFFLAEQGNPVLAYETKEADKYDARTVGRINELLNTIGLENLKKQDYLNVSPEVIDLLRTWFDKLDDKMLNRVGRNYVLKAIDYAENGNKKTEVDNEATRRKIDERVDTVAFEKWLEDMFSGIVEKRGIRNEVDLYTPSGNRRPFEKLYDDITLDNVVKAMSRAPEKGGSGFFHGNIFGAASGTFGSLTQIREAAKQRIESIEPSEIEKDKKAIIDRLSNVKVTDKELDISEMFDLTSNIQDAVAKTHTPEGIYKYLKEFYPDTTLEAAQEISDIVKDIQQLSTRYFEAKPYRAVGFDEVKLAVVPEGTSQDIFDGLRERGVDVRTYTDGDQEQRKQVVADTAKETGLNFRINADERKYANENIDKAIAFVRGISVKEASDMRKDDERRIKEKTTELYSKVLDNQFDDITLQLIDEFIANVTPNNPYRQPLSKRLPPSVGRRMRGVERNNAVDGLFTRIAESTVREAGSSVERTRARREAEEKKKELLKGWAIATGNWHTSVSDFTDNTEPIGKGKDSVVYNSNDGNNVIKVSFGKNKEKKFSPDIDAVNLFNAVFPNTRYEILGYGEIDGKFVKFLKQPSVRFSENPTVSFEDRIDYMRNLGFEPINKEKSAFSNGELVVADVQKGNIVRDVNGKIRVIDADVKLHTKDIGGNYTYPPASDDILPQSGGISFRTANENQQAFISNALASLDKIQMKSGNTQAWINKLQQAGGLKKEEDKWIGLTDWLKEQDGNISKEDVAEYIREHQVRIEDVNYGESVVFVKDRLAKKYGDIVNEAFQIDEEYGEENIYVKDLDKAIEFYNSQNTITPILDSLYMDEDGEVDQRAMEDTLIEWMSGIASEVASENENKEIDPIRLQYTTGGLVKNREIALVVPDIQPYNKTDLVHFGDAGEGRAIAWARFGDAKGYISEYSKFYAFEEEMRKKYFPDRTTLSLNKSELESLNEEEREEFNKLRDAKVKIPFKEARVNVLVIDEIQSKRHQDAKEKGYQENFDANIYHLEKNGKKRYQSPMAIMRSCLTRLDQKK